MWRYDLCCIPSPRLPGTPALSFPRNPGLQRFIFCVTHNFARPLDSRAASSPSLLCCAPSFPRILGNPALSFPRVSETPTRPWDSQAASLPSLFCYVPSFARISSSRPSPGLLRCCHISTSDRFPSHLYTRF